MEWHEGIDQLSPHIVNISTPESFGTGCLISESKKTGLCAIATAAHVVNRAEDWNLPIRLHHPHSKKSILIKPEKRAIFVYNNSDSAVIIINAKESEFAFPEKTICLFKKDYHLKEGVEIGWLGFPSISPNDVCFFSGRISKFFENNSCYLVDGVAINGVSGGPAFVLTSKEHIEIVGIVSAYMPNRATGETLPGLSMIQDVSKFHDISERFKNLDEAKSSEKISSEENSL